MQGTEPDTSLPIRVRCFFDQGSQQTFVTRSLQDRLELRPNSKISLAVHHGFGNTTSTREYDVVNMMVTLGRRKRRISAIVVQTLPNAIHTPGLKEVANDLQQRDIRLADAYTSDTVKGIDILIGSDYYGRYVLGLTNRRGIDLLKTSAGYVIYGPIPSSASQEMTEVQLRHITVANFTVFPDEPPIHRLWDLETIGIDPSAPAPQDTAVYQNYLDTVIYTDRYYVRLPWKQDHPPLPNNYKMAVGQLHAMHKSLSAKPHLLEHYHQVIQEQQDQGFIEVIHNPRVHASTHYIPHHAVEKDSPTTPLRIVYNCSAKVSREAPSLNDCLMKGPALTEKLGDILVTFRTNDYAFTADISKAFLRIGLQEIDRDFTRFLWLEDPYNPRSRIITYRFASVLFGATSSPFLLQATLDFHLRKSTSPFKELIQENFYVDNLIGTMNSERSLLEYYQDANKELRAANMPLREWASCSRELQQQIQRDQIGAQTECVNILGLQWDTEADTLQLKPVQFDRSPDTTDTKRSLLADISKVFDPLGLFSPVTVRGKILLQQTWKKQLGWDDPLPQDIVGIWETLAKDLCQLNQIIIPRSTCSEDSTNHLVVFCDASTSAYGVAAYIIAEQHSQLLMAKTRVAPLKSRTLPQLELTALQLGAQIAHYISTTLHRIPFNRVTLFTDNEATLQWVRNDNCAMPYVRNRVHKIHELAQDMQILHVPSGENPADLLTRGVTYKKLVTKSLEFWIHGPAWLTDPTKWPTQKPFVVVQELITDVDTEGQTAPPAAPTSPIDPTRFSKFTSLIRTTQIVFNVVKCSLNPTDYWMKHIQQKEYPKVYQYLKSRSEGASPETLRVYSLRSPIKQFVKDLGLFLDRSGIIRSHNRLRYSLYHDEDQILLPPKSHVTTLLILHVHRSIKHGGMAETLAQLRLQFWVPKGRPTVKRALKDCALCDRIQTKRMTNPGPPPLPRERVQFTRPFDRVGIDYTGAIFIRDELTGELTKVYICLFTCTCSRAVHLELARDMSTSTFIHLFRRFCARFSTPSLVISDNGSSFKASAEYFKSLFEDPAVKAHFEDQKISWKFIAPKAAWQGGFYERLVGVVKGCLRKTLFKKLLSWDELVTLLLEVEQCVNNRPLTYVTSELPDLVALTPNHLLKGEATRIMPPVATADALDPLFFDHELLNQQYTKLSELIKKFVQIWSKDYLAALKEKHYGNVPPHQAAVVREGDIVLLSSDQPRNRWPLGRITKVFPDADQIVRQVEVFSQGHKTIRTLDKLHSLELANRPEVRDMQVDARTNDTGSTDPDPAAVEVPPTRPKRKAARKADADRQRLIDAEQL